MSDPKLQSIADLLPHLNRLGAEKLGLFRDTLQDWLHMPVVVCHHHRNLGVMLRERLSVRDLHPGAHVSLPPVGVLQQTVLAVSNGITADMQQLSDALTSLCGGRVGLCSNVAQLAM